MQKPASVDDGVRLPMENQKTHEPVPLKSRAPLSRMLLIHELLQKNGFPNRRKLADELEISPKTVQRDIDFMRDRLGLPIEYDERHYGYRYTEPVHAFPTVQVSEGELIALFMAQKALPLYKGTPFEQPLKAAFEKLSANMKEMVSFSPQRLDGAFSFSMRGQEIADMEIFSLLSRATLQSLEVQFKYCRLESRSYQLRRVQPYHLSCVEGQWYLFAFDLERIDMRTFALSRMKEVETMEKRFVRDAGFSFDKHLSDSFGVRTRSGRYRVRIWFDFLAAKMVRERAWHHSQEMKELPRGELELSLRLGSLTEVKRWILSWGEHARALAPVELITRLKGEAEALKRYYNA